MSAVGVVFALLLLAFAAFSNGLGRVSLTAPITFVAAGAAISSVAADPSVEAVLQIRLVAEVTLALILFHDAARVRPRQLRTEARRGTVTSSARSWPLPRPTGCGRCGGCSQRPGCAGASCSA